MNKKIAISIIISVLLIGIMSAGLISYFGKISTTFSIETPIFYTAPGHNLLVNEKPDNSATYTINDGESEIFETEELEETDFSYIPKANFYARAKLVYSVNDTSQNLILIFGYEDADENKHEICSSNLLIETFDFEDYDSISCTGTSKPSNIKKFYYEIKGDCNDCEYKVSTKAGDFYTKIELSSA